MSAAFVWWAMSLVNYSKTEKDLRLQLYKSDSLHLAGEISHNMFTGKFTGKDSMKFEYHGKTMFVDTQLLKYFLLKKYPPYDICFYPGKSFDKIFTVTIKKSVIASENKKYLRKRDSWIYEGVVMTIIMLILALALYLYLDRILKLNSQQNNFLLAITHELKTPVAGTKLAIQTAQRKITTEQKDLDKLLRMADNNVSRLSRIIDNVLMATKVQSSHRMKFIIQDLVLEELIEDTLAEIKDSLPETAVISAQYVPELLIRGDRELLQMALSNLIGNAVKYSKQGEEKIHIQTFILKGRVAMSVSDNGIGIPLSERKNIFKMFYRMGDERTRSSSGTGLGLFLVEKLLRQHSAIISISDNQPNGTAFNLLFKERANV
ncbi:MAG: sensor histidine kinase [Sphingomonadales bacterium]